MDLKSPTPVIHHHHHRSKTVKDAKVDAVANEVLGQLNNARQKANAALQKGKKKEGGEAPIDEVNVGELSCRARTATNVGLDQLVNHYFKAGKTSFQRYELYRPEFTWGDRDLDFQEIDCEKSCNANIKSEIELGGKKCLNCEDSIASGNARNFFTVLQPLVGKLFQKELKGVFDRMKPKMTQEEVAKEFGPPPFEKDYFLSFSKNKKGSCTKKVIMQQMIRNKQVGFDNLVNVCNKIQRVLRCSAFRKQINAEDIQTTIIDNDFFELKMPAEWINEFVMNTTDTQNLGFNNEKLQIAVTLGQLEQFMTTEGTFVGEAVLEEEFNDACKQIRDFMIHLWASARKVKCGDNGWTPAKGVVDPMDSTEDNKKEEEAHKDAKF